MNKAIITITLLVLVSFIECGLNMSRIKQNKKLIEFARAIANIAKSSKARLAASSLVSNVQSNLKKIADRVDKNKIGQIGALGVPAYAVDKFKAAVFAHDATATSFHFELDKTNVKLVEGLGVIEVDGNVAKFAYVEATTTGNAIQQTEPHSYRKCKRFLFFKKCRTITERRNRGFSLHELEMIKNALRELSAVKITERINAIKELRESL